MEFRILGPLEVLDDSGCALALGGPKQRALLAVLLLDAGAVVSADRLIEELWGEDPPGSARGVLQVYVANLRKLLEPGRTTGAAPTVLRTQPPGYRLDPGAHRFDLVTFRRLAATGTARAEAGDPHGAAEALTEALALWRGPVLSDLAVGLDTQGTLAQLEEQRLAALEQRVEVELALGRHRDLVGELEALVAAHPLREQLWSLLIVALYRCQRQAEALDAYRKARHTLAEELGIDPGRPLQELERAVLAQDPALDWTPPATTPPPPDPVQPPAPARRPGEERKVVTVLCCGLTGAPASGPVDPEDARARLRPYQELVLAEIRRFGGTPEWSYGQRVVGVFGAPSAHEDDPERAVRAGLRILEAARERTADPGDAVSVRVGVSTGEALVALDPGNQAGEGLVSGQVADTAAELGALASAGGLLVDEATWRPTRNQVNYEAVEPAPPGRGPLGAWRATAARSRHGAELREPAATPFVGREDELAVLHGLYRRAVREESLQLVVVTGEAGVGKSRLVSGAVRRSWTASPTWSTGGRAAACPTATGVAFWALGEIVKAEAGILESDGPETAAGKLAARRRGGRGSAGRTRLAAGAPGAAGRPDRPSGQADPAWGGVRGLAGVPRGRRQPPSAGRW